MPRFYSPMALATGATLDLPPGAARHVQVLRLQPGDAITLFNGEGGEFEARVEKMGRSDVQVQIGAHHAIEREAPRALHLAVGMPANERMDWLVEKATELGVASIQPLLAERTVLRLAGERAEKKRAHWQGIAAAACEQCGRNRVPAVHPPQPLMGWLLHWQAATGEPAVKAAVEAAFETAGRPPPQGLLLSLRTGTAPLRERAGSGAQPLVFLSGPEGGLSQAEEDAALAHGFLPCTLGPRVLRAETAALAALAAL